MKHDEKKYKNKTKQNKKRRGTLSVYISNLNTQVLSKNFPIIITKTTTDTNKTHSKLLSHGH